LVDIEHKRVFYHVEEIAIAVFSGEDVEEGITIFFQKRVPR